MEGVVEPMMNGVGGDIMVMVWDESSQQLLDDDDDRGRGGSFH
jgi:gamma-glutamyltranspeptidase